MAHTSKSRVSNDDKTERTRIYTIDRVCKCGTEINGLARRTVCHTCWLDLMTLVHGAERAAEMDRMGMYSRIDD